MLYSITIANRGPETATIHLLPTLWFRNTWSWWPGTEKPHLEAAKRTGMSVVAASHPELGDDGSTATGRRRCSSPRTTRTPSGCLTRPTRAPTSKTRSTHSLCGNTGAVNPAAAGTKAAAHYPLEVAAGQSVEVRLCLSDATQASRPFAAFEKTMDDRRREADEFYQSFTPPSASADTADVMRQAFGGLFWTKRPTSSTSTCGCASTAWTRSSRPRRSRSGTAIGSICSTTTSSRCPTSGNTPGTRHGISPFTPSA